MVEFIARRIEEAKEQGGATAGQAKYKAYFVKTSIYRKYRDDVDTILETDGNEDCIVY